jgi:hypothetical protein
LNHGYGGNIDGGVRKRRKLLRDGRFFGGRSSKMGIMRNAREEMSIENVLGEREWM